MCYLEPKNIIVLNYTSGNVHVMPYQAQEDNEIEELLKAEFGKDRIEWMTTTKPDFLHIGWSN